MSIESGQKLTHYEIVEPIGKGGMGEVYRARDGKLGRDVAIKVLPDELAQDEERLRRFQREAKVLASLNHPNIASIYGFEHSEGTHYLVLELVPGETLAERIVRGPIPVDEALDIAGKIAEALEEAHARGIVHRDLKPANVKLTEDGKVKVWDFGLAKAFVDDDAEGDASTSMSPTITRDSTRVGVILGTAAYMSPEQAKGKRVDKRADVWAFGAVLYEMLTGRRPFDGSNPAEILSSIIKDTPDSVSELNPRIPRELAKLVKRCLAKDPIRRFQSSIDLRNELEETKQEIDSGVVTTAHEAPVPARGGVRALLGAALVLVAAAVWMLWPRERDSPSVTRLANPTQVTSAIGVERHPVWSPDGQTIAFESARGGNVSVWVTQVGSEAANRTADHDGQDGTPSWSPDGAQIAFASSRDGGNIFVMSALG